MDCSEATTGTYYLKRIKAGQHTVFLLSPCLTVRARQSFICFLQFCSAGCVSLTPGDQ